MRRRSLIAEITNHLVKGVHLRLTRILDLDPQLTTTEHEYLQRLEEFLWWAGRYPIPKKPGSYAERHASRLSFKTTDPGLSEKLFDKLASLIEQSV